MRKLVALTFTFLLAACPAAPQSEKQTGQPIEAKPANENILEIVSGDIKIGKEFLHFRFDTMDYNIYAQIDPEDEDFFRRECEAIRISGHHLTKLIINADPLKSGRRAAWF